MKRIKIELKQGLTNEFYTVTKMINAAVITDARGRLINCGMDIPARDVDGFARDRRWDVTIFAAKD
jgi:hypothetical protein